MENSEAVNCLNRINFRDLRRPNNNKNAKITDTRLFLCLPHIDEYNLSFCDFDNL